jgi:L-fuculose-phosphate aldolase
MEINVGNKTFELVKYYHLLRERDINDSHSGNGSVRDGDSLWITPTGACADTLQPWQIVRCALEGAAAAGASSDLALHRQVYLRNPRARAVLHGHAVHAIALTMDGNPFEPVDLEGDLYFTHGVSVIDIPYDNYFSASPALVGEALASHPAVIVRGHGLYAWGENLNQAYKWLCSLELAARIKYLALRSGTLD